MDKDKSVNGVFAGNDLSETKKALGKMQSDLPTHIKYMAVVATLHAAKFKALLNEGFSRPEALELCKNLY